MKLLDVLRRFRHDGATGAITTPAGFDKIKAEVDKEARDKRLRENIRVNPSLYSRATRRLNGFRGRAVPLDYVRPETSIFVPRYVRRHIEQMQSPTRRGRRVGDCTRALVARYQLRMAQ